MMNDDDYTIVAVYGAEYRGIVQYYLLASDVYRLNRLRWVMETSMLKTLAGKHRSTGDRRWRRSTRPKSTPRTGRARASRPASSAKAGSHWSRGSAEYRSGGRRRRSSQTASRAGRPRPKELVTRLLANRCEICERTGNVEVHHIRKLADLGKFGQAGRPAWAAIMAKRRRKSLVVCLDCHDRHPLRKASGENHGLVTGEPDARKAGKSGSGGGCPEKPIRELAGQPIPRWIA